MGRTFDFDFEQNHSSDMMLTFDMASLASSLYSLARVSSTEDMLVFAFKGNRNPHLIQIVDCLAQCLLQINPRFFELSKEEQQQVILTYIKTRFCEDVFFITSNAQTEAEVTSSSYMVGFLIDGLYYALSKKPASTSQLLIGGKPLKKRFALSVVGKPPQALRVINDCDMTIRSLYIKSILNQVAIDACKKEIAREA